MPSIATIIKGIRTGAIAAAFGLAGIHGASALNEIGLYSGSGLLAFDGMSFLVQSCTFANGAGSHTCASTDNLFLVQGAPGTQLIVEAQNGSGGQIAIFDTLGSPTAGTYDLHFQLGVTAANPATADKIGLDGTVGDPADNTKMTVGETITHSNSAPQSATVNLNNTPQTVNFLLPDTSFLLNKDIGLLASQAVTGDHLVLTDVTQTFSLVVPEPSSAVSLITGLLLLGRARRRRAAR